MVLGPSFGSELFYEVVMLLINGEDLAQSSFEMCFSLGIRISFVRFCVKFWIGDKKNLKWLQLNRSLLNGCNSWNIVTIVLFLLPDFSMSNCMLIF